MSHFAKELFFPICIVFAYFFLVSLLSKSGDYPFDDVSFVLYQASFEKSRFLLVEVLLDEIRVADEGLGVFEEVEATVGVVLLHRDCGLIVWHQVGFKTVPAVLLC